MRAARESELWSTRARIVVAEGAMIDDALRIAHHGLAEIDRIASRFRSDSELSRIAPTLHRGVDISPTLALLVRRALDAAILSGGLVDPTLGHGLEGVGYDRDIRLVLADDGEGRGRPVRAVVSRRPGWRSVRLVGTHLTVPAHLALDLGASAKAVAADQTAQAIAERLGCGVLVSLGGDISTAGPEPEGGWNITVQDGANEPTTTVRIAAGSGLATSSTLHRRWRRGDRWMHHILDPRTGLPAETVWRTASVGAESCFVANALSTAAIVRGSSAPDWLKGRGVARLVHERGGIAFVGGWPATGEHESAPEVLHG